MKELISQLAIFSTKAKQLCVEVYGINPADYSCVKVYEDGSFCALVSYACCGELNEDTYDFHPEDFTDPIETVKARYTALFAKNKADHEASKKIEQDKMAEKLKQDELEQLAKLKAKYES